MSLAAFWAAIDQQLALLEKAKTADEVIYILGKSPHADGAADAFFAGSGGDGSVAGSLSRAGWNYVWFEAGYHWAMRAPNGDAITYVEGDIYRGNHLPMPNRSEQS